MARDSLAGSVARGLVAGLAGTAAMTAYQLAVRRARGEPLGTAVPRTWADAPPPAQLAKQTAVALGKGRAVTKRQVPLLTSAMHWAYGTLLGAFYGLGAHRFGPDPLIGGPAFGTAAWAAAYGELVPLGIYKPPWEYPPAELGLDLSYHLVYGAAVAGVYAALER